LQQLEYPVVFLDYRATIACRCLGSVFCFVPYLPNLIVRLHSYSSLPLGEATFYETWLLFFILFSLRQFFLNYVFVNAMPSSWLFQIIFSALASRYSWLEVLLTNQNSTAWYSYLYIESWDPLDNFGIKYDFSFSFFKSLVATVSSK